MSGIFICDETIEASIPDTLNDLISDCQRAGIELEFTDTIEQKLFKFINTNE